MELLSDRDGDGPVKCQPRSSVGAGVVCQQHTDIVVTEFENRLFIIATQLQKIGVLVEVFVDGVSGQPATPTYESKVLFGKDEPEIHAVAKSLTEKLNFTKRTVFGLALTEYSSLAVKQLERILVEIMQKLNSSI